MEQLNPPDPRKITVHEWRNWALKTIKRLQQENRLHERRLNAARRIIENLKQTRD